ncbi:TPA: hypothetical protein NGU14_004546 [Vibrio parahaemolyticus]|uniref:HTH-like domain-containing protein n=1 Tax=Vibrio parahaemolyticus TaxID=670 RepID=UPI000C285E9C|nr:hypothetical protein [Vibrio parahaemolyticus]PJR25692.1 hypothetical protein CFG65_10745 [Vibrio parahaemolyticus]HAS6932174.1 hypothetical protein [Vibrio parahaemolyticus]HCE2452893.1 hypothetical protein [Vibrio parahaemolyticus]HCG8456215.1 hypothetical protein [Vibrio parahaemolyticus]
MTLNDLGTALEKMYRNAPANESVAMIHLFGIQYAEQIKDLNVSCKALAKAAGINESYGTEISKGIKLSKYVSVKVRT